MEAILLPGRRLIRVQMFGRPEEAQPEEYGVECLIVVSVVMIMVRSLRQRNVRLHSAGGLVCELGDCGVEAGCSEAGVWDAQGAHLCGPSGIGVGGADELWHVVSGCSFKAKIYDEDRLTSNGRVVPRPSDMLVPSNMQVPGYKTAESGVGISA